jgi:hypothetical protein
MVETDLFILLQDYYPWSLNYILVFEMPWVLNGKNFFIKNLFEF